MPNKSLAINSLHDLDVFCGKLAPLLTGGDILFLGGEIGVGKTTFVRSLARSLGCETQATSPTFTLIHRYDGRVPVIHMDLYRLKGGNDILELDLSHYFKQTESVLAIEWPERLENQTPDHYLNLRFDFGDQDQSRLITVDAKFFRSLPLKALL